jgi:hypothetical protein
LEAASLSDSGLIQLKAEVAAGSIATEKSFAKRKEVPF